MTVPSTQIRADYTGTGSTGPFSFPFCVFNVNNLSVVSTDLLGVDTILVYGVDYTVAGIKAATDYTQGGNVTLVSALTSGYHLTLISAQTGVQETSIKNNSEYYAYLHENEFDALAIMDLQMQEQLQRALSAPISEPDTVNMTLPSIANRRLKVLGFDTNGEPIATSIANTTNYIPYTGATTDVNLNNKALNAVNRITVTADILAGTLMMVPIVEATDHIFIGNPVNSCGIYAGMGAPSDSNGNNGDWYLRGSDGTVGSNLYKKANGTWSAIL